MIDITRSINPALPNWPGDTAYGFELVARIGEGSSVNVGRFQTSTHTGTHVDAPYHYLKHGQTLDQIPLETWVGPCLVVNASGATQLNAALLSDLDLSDVSKVLFKTGQPDTWLEFPRNYAVVDSALPAFLAAHGITLLGTDAPSVDPLTSKDLPAHMAFARAGVCILEGLALEHAPAGRHRLVCLPLKLEGADAAPARVILR